MCGVERIDCFCYNSNLAWLNEPAMSHRAGVGAEEDGETALAAVGAL